ncbi:hypothetical protein J6590_088946 [Homalodisca vitripennis]|nr:hypothetical protein J6590_088946 [Homalodisca vitripennis]
MTQCEDRLEVLLSQARCLTHGNICNVLLSVNNSPHTGLPSILHIWTGYCIILQRPLKSYESTCDVIL